MTQENRPPAYVHPTTIASFEEVYRKEYEEELASCDRWIQWCREREDMYGVNFHQGLRGALVFNNIKMFQLLRVLKQEPPNKATPHSKLEPAHRTLARLFTAAQNMDWQQVVLNGGPPCFGLDESGFCGRAERWAGHPAIHEFVPLHKLLKRIADEAIKDYLNP